MVQLPATAAIEYVAACCITRTNNNNNNNNTLIYIAPACRMTSEAQTRTITKIVRGAYARSPQVQCLYEPSRLSVPSIVA